MSPLTSTLHRNQSCIYRCARSTASFALIAMLGIPLVHAQSLPSPARCTEAAQQGLTRVGGWAAEQCASDVFVAFAPIAFSRCSDQAWQGLRNVGGWAEVQCASRGAESS
jgi:hypothetical protein